MVLSVPLSCQQPLPALVPATATPQEQKPADAPKTEPAPWQLARAVGTPTWLHVSGEQRTRYETLDEQFRVRTPIPYGEDEDVLALRTSLRFDATEDVVAGTLEILDARQYGIDDTSFVDTTMVNTTDVLQAYGDLRLPELGGGKSHLRAGREAIDLGSRRLMARNAYRNTINAFNGVGWLWQGSESTARVFWMLPVDRLPADFASLQDNEWDLDVQSLDTQFAGLYWSTKTAERTTLELYVLGLDERGVSTRRRELLTPGLRFFHNTNNNQPVARRNEWFYEVELAGQLGESKANTQSASPTLDHLAGFAHASLGYSFDAPLSPAVQVAYDYATGDQDPTDGSNERFDTLYGARRFEYGPTGIWGAVARANLNSPELRLLLQPAKSVSVMIAYRGVWLAEARDSWTSAGLRDASGNSGNHVGEQIEARVRWELIPKSFDVELGGAVLLAGSFQESASAGVAQDASYGYVQSTWRF